MRKANQTAHLEPRPELTPERLRTLPLSTLARMIAADWGARVNYAAVPYLRAMFDLPTVGDCYGAEDGRSIVRYFLSNASTWRGPVAAAIKAELRYRVR